MTYKIGLLSTHGTGKTTLAYDIAAELKKKNLTIRVVAELATVARERAIPIDKKTTLEAQAWILHRQCAAELEAKIYEWDVAICDRTVLDNYCYLENAVGPNSNYRKMALEHYTAHPYDCLFYLPVVGKFSPKKRDPDQEFQRAIDEKIVKFMADYNINYITLPSDRRKWKSLVVQYTLKDLKELEEKKEQERRKGMTKWAESLP
jgi:thymidylate kinase